MKTQTKTLDGLYADAVNTKPRDFDFSEGFAEKWDIVYPDIEDWTQKKCISYLEEHSGSMDEGEYDDIDDWRNAVRDTMIESESYCPMMNYLYALPGLRHSPSTAQALIDDTNCVIVIVDDEPCMALSGGGMDFSWDICEAYMLLGFLPPVHFCRLPAFAGKKLDETAQWIINGCKKSCEVSINWAKSSLRDLDNLEKQMPKE